MRSRIKKSIERLSTIIDSGRTSYESHHVIRHGMELLNYLASPSHHFTLLQMQELHDVIVIGTALFVLSKDFCKYRDDFGKFEILPEDIYGFRGHYHLTEENLCAHSHVDKIATKFSGFLYADFKKIIFMVGMKALVDRNRAFPDLNSFLKEQGIIPDIVFGCISKDQLAKYDSTYKKINGNEFELNDFIHDAIVFSVAIKKSNKRTDFSDILNKSIELKKQDKKKIESISRHLIKINWLETFYQLNTTLAQCYLKMGRGTRVWLLQGTQCLFSDYLFMFVTSWVLNVSSDEAKKIFLAANKKHYDSFTLFAKNTTNTNTPDSLQKRLAIAENIAERMTPRMSYGNR